jgi:hypothetical protein
VILNSGAVAQPPLPRCRYQQPLLGEPAEQDPDQVALQLRFAEGDAQRGLAVCEHLGDVHPAPLARRVGAEGRESREQAGAVVAFEAGLQGETVLQGR